MTIVGPPAIDVTGLRKSFGDRIVLDGIELQVSEGTIFALSSICRVAEGGGEWLA